MTVAELFRRGGFEQASLVLGHDVQDRTVTGVAYDSRTLVAGEVFVAIKGERCNGTDFADQARDRGAVAVVAETASPPGFGTPWFEVTDTRATLAALAAAINRDPSHELLVVGTTGTNGKTTTTYLIEGILEHAGIPCGRVSSVAHRVADEEQTATCTTPEAPELQALLRRMVDQECRACAMEVSSHALALRRVDHTTFGAAVFTNLTREHLDFHGDMSRYFHTKRRLFEMTPETSPAVVNVDDPYGQRLAGEVNRPVTYAIEKAADVTPHQMDLSANGIELDVRTKHGPLHLESSLLGRGNTYNILAAAATGAALDLPFRAIQKGIASVTGVRGRMQVVSDSRDNFTVLIDFAHTDDALRSLLETSRKITRGRLITVFGCGGERDATKRPLMGAVAERFSDFVIITSDNPRSEEPYGIAREIERGLENGVTPWMIILDRTEAIVRAIEEACAGDLVVVAGKGHEQYQIIGNLFVPFDDASVARTTLATRRSRPQLG